MNRDVLNANRLTPCGCCGRRFPEHALLGTSLLRNIVRFKEKHGVSVRRRDRNPLTIMEPVRTCVFCSQFFDCPVIVDAAEVEQRAGTGEAAGGGVAGDGLQLPPINLAGSLSPVMWPPSPARSETGSVRSSASAASPAKRAAMAAAARRRSGAGAGGVESPTSRDLRLRVDLEHLRTMRAEAKAMNMMLAESPQKQADERAARRRESQRRRNESLVASYEHRLGVDSPSRLFGSPSRAAASPSARSSRSEHSPARRSAGTQSPKRPPLPAPAKSPAANERAPPASPRP